MSRPEKFRYRKEKKISIQFGEEKQDFLLIALSARQTEQAMNEAQECFQKQTKNAPIQQKVSVPPEGERSLSRRLEAYQRFPVTATLC